MKDQMKFTITTQELQILKLASEGKPINIIAGEINVRKEDVSKSLKSTCGKLSTKNPLAAMQKLLKNDFEVED